MKNGFHWNDVPNPINQPINQPSNPPFVFLNHPSHKGLTPIGDGLLLGLPHHRMGIWIKKGVQSWRSAPNLKDTHVHANITPHTVEHYVFLVLVVDFGSLLGQQKYSW